MHACNILWINTNAVFKGGIFNNSLDLTVHKNAYHWNTLKSLNAILLIINLVTRNF